MKKFLVLFVCLGLILTGLSVSACHFKNNKKKTAVVKTIPFEIIPTIDSPSEAKNTVWVGTFQLVWNDLIDEVVKHPVEFAQKSPMADLLNKREFTTDDLLDSSYYKKAALASPEIKKEIEKAIKEKFNETSDILGMFNWTPAKGKYILYAMLKKDFEYIKPFDKLDDAEFSGSKGMVKYFGINKKSSSALRYTVRVLFYNGPDDYAIALRSKQGDDVYLYRTDDEKTLNLLYDDMMRKSDKFMGIRTFGKLDEFKAPIIDFKKECEFTELCNKPIKNSDFIISKAIETVQFKMDETGVKLKSEAGIMVGCTCCPTFREEPRYFYFDKRYVIFLQEKSKPYFAMKIEDAKALQ